MRQLLRDLSLSAIAAGFVTVLVGFTSSAALVFQAARSLGASPEQIASWIWALGMGMGLTCIGLSLRYRMPVVTAWSTPGSAMLISSAAGLPLSDAIGAFVISALMITVAGFSGLFERMLSRIPVALASAMLGGVLLRFGTDAFAAMQTQLGLVLAMFAVYVLARRMLPRYAVILTLLTGMFVAAWLGILGLDTLRWQMALPVFVMPTFSFAAIIRHCAAALHRHHGIAEHSRRRRDPGDRISRFPSRRQWAGRASPMRSSHLSAPSRSPWLR